MKKVASQKLQKRVSVKETILAIPVGSSVRIKTRHIKQGSAWMCIKRLNEQGYKYTCTTAGLVDEFEITRSK